MGEKNLNEVAFMQLLGKGISWNFGSLLKNNGSFQLKEISTLDQVLEQTLIARNFCSIVLNYEEGPAGKGLKSLADVAGEPSDEQKAAAKLTLAIENPSLHNPSSVDCVSYHVASVLRYHVKSSDFPDLLSSPNLYKNGQQDLKQLFPPANGINLRAFGYFSKEPSISQRTINETAALTDYINTMYLNP